MITWNMLYLSNGNLKESIHRLQLEDCTSDILVRIHTSIHKKEEAVELAKFVKSLIPNAKIFGTSTSAVIYRGRTLYDHCVISITKMERGSQIQTAILETYDENDFPIAPALLAQRVSHTIPTDRTSILLTFVTRMYRDVYFFINECNEIFPQVKMIGGLANMPESSLEVFEQSGFIFNEEQYSEKAMILASIQGKRLHSIASYATGVESFGSDISINKTDGDCIIELNHHPAPQYFYESVGSMLKDDLELSNLFPYVYTHAEGIPIFVRYSCNNGIERLCANHNVLEGSSVRRAFIYDKKIEIDNRKLFRDIENFEYCETIFSYSCSARASLYPNTIKWELSPYEDTNICGCITEGEILHSDGKNIFANCAFVLCAVGERPKRQSLNSYPFRYTDTLFKDNERLLKYLMTAEIEYHLHDNIIPHSDSIEGIVRLYESKLMYEELDQISNMSSLMRDIQLRGCDRICMIHIAEISLIKTVFGEEAVFLARQRFIRDCLDSAKAHNYFIYEINTWTIGIGAPSYMETLQDFECNMKKLQNIIPRTEMDNLTLIPYLCLIDGCTIENIMDIYNVAISEMQVQKIHFAIYKTNMKMLDENAYREKYKMIKLLNSVIQNDDVIPFYQGIHDNKKGIISHYEALMRIRDKDGKIYLPYQFLDIAREFGDLYEKISGIMICKVFERFKDLDGIRVSMNLGIRDIKNETFIQVIYDFLSFAKHPENFIFEILEDEDIHDYDSMYDFVSRIHELGGKVSLDDFGSGYSNLLHIINLNLDYIKIDGSIVRRCVTDKKCEHLISIISNWKQETGNAVCIVAEFVENMEIQELLMKYGIDYSQGYLFSKPAPELMS
ncbi:MAG TPA: diguanylate cyclase [Ruminococcus sp.]|nr:diguanylate cyclase [Ruminococcus sp.]